MVKALISAIVSLFIIVGASAFEQNYLNNSFDEFEKIVKITYEKTENHTAVKEDVLTAQKTWVEKKKTLHIFIPHNDIKEIDLWVSECSAYTKLSMFDEAITKLDVLKTLATQLPKNFSLRIENLF